jgi:hypothetical protein
MEKFAFVSCDWKEELDADRISNCLAAINEVARVTYVNDGSDQKTLAVFTPGLQLTAEQWSDVISATMGYERDDEVLPFPNHSPRDASYYEISLEELKEYLVKRKKELKKLTKIKEKESKEMKIASLKEELSKLGVVFPDQDVIKSNYDKS